MVACKLSTAEVMHCPASPNIMNAQDYIIEKLEKLREPVAFEAVPSDKLEEAIYAKVMSKKFRKLKADDDAVRITKKAIELAVKDNKPVVLNVIFGGNKLWRLDEAPEIDWAELFNVMYLMRWLKTIASVYEHGAQLEYYSQDVVVENMNNIPKSETDQYSQRFREMLDWLKQYLPDTVSVSYRRYGDEYNSEEEYLAELEETKKKVLDELGGKLPALSDAQKIATELNVKLRPGQADDPLWREKAEWTHQSIERTPTAERYINDPTMIPTCPTKYPGLIVTGSTKKSYAKFWVGVGVLEKSGDSFNELVLTPKQLETAKFGWEETTIDGLTGKNFSKIRVIK